MAKRTIAVILQTNLAVGEGLLWDSCATSAFGKLMNKSPFLLRNVTELK